MDKALRKAIRKTLEDLTDWSAKGTIANIEKIETLDTPQVERNAWTYLTSKGCLEAVDDCKIRLTAKGWDYHEQLRCPQVFWLKTNWFPFIVALGTIITGLTSVVRS